MKLLVTGASGFIGCALIQALSQLGCTGVATGRAPPSPLPSPWSGRQRDDVLANRQNRCYFDALIHLEVVQHVGHPNTSQIAAQKRVIVEGTRMWLEWAKAHDVKRFVYLSSVKAVGSGTAVHDETDSTPPTTSYGESKAAAEALVRMWADSVDGSSAIILRPAPVFGPGNEANLAAFVRQIMQGRPCYIGDGDSHKSVVSLRNVVAAIIFSLNIAATGSHVFNVSEKETLTVRGLAQLIAALGGFPAPRSLHTALATPLALAGDLFTKITGRDFPLTTPRLRALREASVFPSNKLEAAGFRHPQTLNDGLREMIAWARLQDDSQSGTR